MTSEFILTIDIGTTNLKGILFDEEGNEIFRVTRPNTTRYPEPFFAEQEPQQWIENLLAVMKDINQLCPEKLRLVRAVSLTGQMHGPVLFESESGRVLHPCLIWSDARAVEEVRMLQEMFGDDFFLHEMGNPLQQSFTLPKLLWIKRHRPEVFEERSIKLLFPKDYIGYILGGEVTTDYSDASGSLLFGLREKEWKKEMLEDLGLPQNMLPEVVPSESIIGYVSEEAAATFFLPAGIPIVKGGGDLATTALATGAGIEGNLSLCVGTAGQLLLCTDEVDEETLGKLYVFLHCVQDKYFYLGTVPTGGAALDWFLSAVTGDKKYNLWEKVGSLTDISPRQVILFYPFLLGTGTPYFDYQAKAAFLGLQMNHKIEDMIVAILEGVAFALKESFEKIPTVSGKVRQIILSGGLARLPIFSRIVTNVFNLPVAVSRYADTASVGAFLLAAKALGIVRGYGGSAVGLESNVFPERFYVQYYRKAYGLYRSFLDMVLSFASESNRIQGKEEES